MAGGYLYGDMTWTNTNRRNQAVTRLEQEAATRGFTPVAFGQYPAGVAATGTVGLTFCWTSTDYSALERAQEAIHDYVEQNGGVDGQVATSAIP